MNYVTESSVGTCYMDILIVLEGISLTHFPFKYHNFNLDKDSEQAEEITF